MQGKNSELSCSFEHCAIVKSLEFPLNYSNWFRTSFFTLWSLEDSVTKHRVMCKTLFQRQSKRKKMRLRENLVILLLFSLEAIRKLEKQIEKYKKIFLTFYLIYVRNNFLYKTFMFFDNRKPFFVLVFLEKLTRHSESHSCFILVFLAKLTHSKSPLKCL